MGSVYTPLRYAITYLDSLTLRYQFTDSAQWGSTRRDGSQNHHYGYEFTPRSSTGTQPNGTGGSGSVWGIRNGNWASTFSNGGGIIGPVVNQAPRNAEISAGTYDWAISVQAINDTTNEVRWYLVKTDNKYWFAGSVRAPALTNKFNGIAFWFRDGAVTQFNILDAQVDLRDPIEVPPAPFEAFFVSQWGFIGGRIGGWAFTPGDVDGNVTISGSAPNTGWSAVRGGFLDVAEPSTTKALRVTGQVEFVGGGFEAWSSLRFGVFYSDSAGTIISTPVDSTRWSGTENHHYGYLFLPQSGSNGLVNWQGIGQQGSWGAVVDRPWISTNGPNDYVLGTQLHRPANAVAGAGVYDFAISVGPRGDGTTEVRFQLAKVGGGYLWEGSAIDNHTPLTTTKFNSVAFALNTNASTTSMKLIDVHVDMGDPIPLAVAERPGAGAIPKEYALEQNHPNPFNPSTTINYQLPKNGQVRLTIYNSLGQEVRTLVDSELLAGYYQTLWDARDNAGRLVGSGVYVSVLEAGEFVQTKKMVLLK
jgi:hypothetical protein